ncbi:T9SS type A sorting domain-containing protein, partial [Weeksellaceae bacterium KMM 9724]|uniref:T9SS type A sorting domain-containing protein n=1 Tax=Profundicola chukchiensis TaxID=2961959 RepID=UPI002440E013
PIYVDALPYTTTDNTSNYGDTYDGGQGSNCGSTSQYYLNGDDVVYAYTATEDASINISMTPTETWSGLFVYEDCNDIGVACIAGVSNTTNAERLIEDLMVTAGQTYYIVISTWASPQSTAYNLSITENTCISGTYELSTTGACDTNEFFVNVEITDMGDLTEYTISDDQGSASQTATENGTYTFGPYESLTDVTINLVANDENCNESGTITYRCPAPGDNCDNPLLVESLPYSTTDNTVNYTDAYYDGSPGSSCSTTSSYLNGNDVVYAYTAASDTSINISLLPTGNYAGMFVYDSCDSIGVECMEGGTSGFSTDEILFEEFLVTAGETYYIVISTWAAPQTVGYTLNITENTCVSGSYTLNTINNCDEGEFSVEVNITDMGSLDSYSISDDQGSASQTITEPGTLTFGPYPASEVNTDITFTFEANDANCSANEVVSFRCAPAGEICDSAIEVTSLPYLTEDDTANYGDDYDGSPGANCGSTSNYLGGDDVVYTYTATNDTSINISLQPTATYAGMFVYSSCQNIGVNCLAGGTSGWGTDEILIEEFAMSAGETIYIVISTWAAPQSTGYTLEITENTCIAATYELTAVPQCDTNEFMVEVNITDMGSNDSFEITDDQGSAAQTANEPGTFTFGPYESLTDVSISLTTDDANCSATSSITHRCPGAGDTCENPLIVDSLPYVTDDNTANYEDDYDGSPGTTGCSTTSLYLGGDDVVYAYTATSDTSIKINMSTSATWTGVFVYDSCEAIGVECATGLSNSGSGGVVIEDFEVVEGQTYYIILSSYPSPQSYTYNLTITENSCDPIEYTVSTTDQCEVGEFSVTIDVTSLGSSETLVVSDNQGSESQTLTEAGSLTFGPYTESQIIEFEFTTDDPNCFETVATSFTCPAANDDCMDATELTVGSSFTDNAILGNNIGSTTSTTMPAPGCANYQGGEVWFSVTVPESGNVIIETRNSNLDTFNDTGMAAYNGSCDALTLIACNDDGGEGNGYFSQLSLTGQTPGETIYIAVWEYGNNLEGTFLVGAYDSTMGVADFASRDAVKLYPNPTSSELNVSGIELNQVQVYSASGKLVPVKVTGNIVDTRNLPSGAYFIRMTDAEGKAILRKFIKK